MFNFNRQHNEDVIKQEDWLNTEPMEYSEDGIDPLQLAEKEAVANFHAKQLEAFRLQVRNFQIALMVANMNSELPDSFKDDMRRQFLQIAATMETGATE